MFRKMKIENNIFKCEGTFTAPREGLGELCYKSMKLFKDKTAQYISETDEVDTYENLLRRTVRCAIKMRCKGVKEGEIISICSATHINTCVPFLASLFLGAKVAPLDPNLSVENVTDMIKTVPLKMIFVSTEALNLIEKSIESSPEKPEIIVFGPHTKYENFDFFLKETGEENDFQPVKIQSVKEIAIVIFSSGTTGVPKGICLNHSTITNGAYDFLNNWIKTKSDRIWLNYSFIYGIAHVQCLISATLNGCSRVICRSFESQKFWKIIEKYQITEIILTPSQIIELCREGKPENSHTASIRSISIGSTSIPLRHLIKFKSFLPTTLIWQAYGQTEKAFILTTFNPNSEEDKQLLQLKPESIGRPVQGNWFKIVDLKTGEALGPFENGELRVKSEFILNGYYNRDSSDAFDLEGWYKTGDVLYYDQDNCFYFVERITQLIKYKDIIISPSEIENIIYEIPAVKRTVVIGVPHEEDGNHLLAVVQIDEKHERNITPTDIIKYVEERVDDTKRLRAGVKFIKECPLTATGKPRREDLQKMINDGTI